MFANNFACKDFAESLHRSIKSKEKNNKLLDVEKPFRH